MPAPSRTSQPKLRVEPALLLRRFRYGESSLVVQAFTRNAGRVHLLAKGAYRLSSGYCGVLDLFDTLELSWRPSSGELQTLRGARILERRKELPRDLARYRSALAIVELLDLVCAGPPEPGAFDLAQRTLDRIRSGGPLSEWIVPAFDLRLLGVLGLAPALATCAACAGPAPAVDREGLRAAFSAGAGGRLCLSCAHEARASARRVGTLPVRVLEIADLLARGEGPPSPGRETSAESGETVEAALAGLPVALRGEVRDFVRRFLEYHLETRPRSRQAPQLGRRRLDRRGPAAPAPKPTQPATAHLHPERET